MNAIDKILENQQAWQALSADDESVISNIAIDALSKCADAITTLSENLRHIGYVWISLESIPPAVVEANIQTIETQTGLPIPKVLIEFWKLVGGVSFVDLINFGHRDFWYKNRLISQQSCADGLHIYACNIDWTSAICQDYALWKEDWRQDETEDYLLRLSPDGYHKDQYSGGADYGVFAQSSWKPIWQNFGWLGTAQPITVVASPPDFISYLRTAILECAGFPGLLGAPGFDVLKEQLLQGVPLF